MELKKYIVVQDWRGTTAIWQTKNFNQEKNPDHKILATFNKDEELEATHITAARMYMGEIKNLEDENLKMRDALYCIIGRIEGVEWEGLDMVNAVQKVIEYATEALK